MKICYLVLVICMFVFCDEVGVVYVCFFDMLCVNDQLLFIGGFIDKIGGVYVLQNFIDCVVVQVIVDVDLLMVEGSVMVMVYEWFI